MKIEFLGHASFLLTTSAGTRIVTDPFDPGAYPDALKYRQFDGDANIVTVSHEHSDHGAAGIVGGSPIIIKGDGKFKVAEADVSGFRTCAGTTGDHGQNPETAYVEFLGIATYHDDDRGAKRGRNTVFVISADGLRIAHMGDLGHVLTADQAAEIGAVDVVMVPVGGYYTIDAAQAWKVVEQLSARIVIPMHYANEKCLFPIAGVEDFIAGRPNVMREGVTTFEVGPSNLPEEQSVVVLEPAL